MIIDIGRNQNALVKTAFRPVGSYCLEYDCGLYFCLLSRELKDNLGNDEPEGDMPMLLQTLLSRNPKIFRDKSMPTQHKVWGGKEESLSRCSRLQLSSVHALSLAVLLVCTVTNFSPEHFLDQTH